MARALCRRADQQQRGVPHEHLGLGGVPRRKGGDDHHRRLLRYGLRAGLGEKRRALPRSRPAGLEIHQVPLRWAERRLRHIQKHQARRPGGEAHRVLGLSQGAGDGLKQDGALPNNLAYKAGPALYKTNPLLAAESKYIQVQHYKLFEAFDNVMPGSIDSYWYQTNNGVFGGSLSPASAASSLNTQMQQFLQTQNAG